ncbi:hypothetical protein EGW08_009566 [Elysia chlorotica]|uniref:Uncharacterized protein n=1 Tax=Elysia chlorotica TaxID=188477 RepID=A0A433TM53_ELYCH|nr:hypothetical protein EGW08_009566 [Elysia chlorotica]
MPKLVADPKGRYCWEANFNPVLRMSNNAVASVMFKMDLERAKYNSVLRRLDGEARHELRVSRREMEEVRRELQELKAYQQVAQLTAFKTFDPELKRRAREREERERMRQLEDEKERAAQELENLEEKERDSIRKRLERQRKEEEKRRGISYANMLLLSRKQSISGNNDSQQDAELAQVQLRNRRLSSTGNVYVTLKDIMDSDDVLQRHSDDIMNSRRPSQELGRFSSRRPSHDLALSSRRSSQELSSPSRRPSLASLPPKRRGSNAMSSSAPDLSHTAHPGPVSENVRESFVSSQPEKEKEEEVDEEEEEEEQNYEKKSMLQFRNHVFSKVRSDRRRSRIGSISSLVQQVIQEHKDITENDDNGVGNDDTDCYHPNSQGEPPLDPETKEVSNIFITDISEQNKESENEQSTPSLTSTQHNSLFNKLRIASKMEKGKIDSDNDSSSSRKDKHGVSENSNPFSSPLSKLDSRQGLFEILSQLKKNREESDENDEGEEGGITDTEILDKASTTQNKPTGKPGLLRGLARFKSMANIITEKNREAKEEEGVARIKKLTAAVVMANCAAQGKVPSAFMLHHLSPAMRGEARGRVPRLETVHQESGALKLRPLQMPRSVQRQHEKKFEELMATINGAVHWKVRALRENTGTLNPRQLRRKQREQEQQQKQQQQQQKQQQQQQERQQQQQKDAKKAQPAQPEPELMPMSAVVVRPRRERMALPGACTTTWSLKRFVQKEVRDLLASWQPENARRLRSQRFKDRKEMALKSAGSALVGGTRHGSV